MDSDFEAEPAAERARRPMARHSSTETMPSSHHKPGEPHMAVRGPDDKGDRR
jgi:hypothetical protein